MVITQNLSEDPSKQENSKVINKNFQDSSSSPKSPCQKLSAKLDEISNSTHRLLLSKQNRFFNQNDEIQLLKKQIETLTNENRQLKTQNIRQNKELNMLETRDLNAPKLIEQSEMERLSLRDQLRKIKISMSQEQKQRNESQIEAVKLRLNLDKCQSLLNNSDLMQRNELQNKLEQTENQLSFAQKQLKEAYMKLEMVDKNYKIELASVRKNTRFHINQCLALESKCRGLHQTLMEKEKLLEIQNIYTNRLNINKIKLKVQSNLNEWTRCSCDCRREKTQDQLILESNSYNNNTGKPSFQNSVVRSKSMDSSKTRLKWKPDKEDVFQIIREIIKEEIKSLKIDFNVEQINTLPKISKQEKSINSPFISIEQEYNNEKEAEYPMFSHDESQLSLNNDILSARGQELHHTLNLDYKLAHSTLNDVLFDNLNNDSPRKSESNISNERVEPAITMGERFLHPNESLTGVPDDWWNDVETITLLNDICDVSDSFYKQDKYLASLSRNKPIPKCQLLKIDSNYDCIPQNSTGQRKRSNYPLEKIYKLPEIIQSDMQNIRQKMAKDRANTNSEKLFINDSKASMKLTKE